MSSKKCYNMQTYICKNIHTYTKTHTFTYTHQNIRIASVANLGDFSVQKLRILIFALFNHRMSVII